MKAQTDNATALILVLIAAASLVSMIGTLRIDNIVNGTLYHYGLQFSTKWAYPYWTMEGIVFAMGWFIIAGSMVFELRLVIRRRRGLSKPESMSSRPQPLQNETPEKEANPHAEAEESKPETTTSATKIEDVSNKNVKAEEKKVETTALAVKTEGASTEVGVLLEKLSELEERTRKPTPVEKKKGEQTSELTDADQKAD